MTSRPAYDEITLALGSCSVRLRPSLRAATHFAHLDGFDDLPWRITEFNLGTIRDLITATATDRQEAAAFLDQIGRTPLQAVADAVISALHVLVIGFVPASDDDGRQAGHTVPPTPWSDLYRDLFRVATGWLGWTPEAAWNATPTEINEAFNGWLERIEATTPKMADEKSKPASRKHRDPEQAARNIAEGLDPDFDRAGLQALKASIAGRKR